MHIAYVVHHIYSENNPTITFPSTTTALRLGGDLALDKGQSLGSVLGNISLVSLCIVSSAAVWVLSIAVRLDDAGGSWRALEARRASSKLGTNQLRRSIRGD